MIEKKEPEKPYKQGLVGKKAKITTKTQVFEGQIVLETKNTLKIKTSKGTRTVLKKSAEITIENKKIKGTSITKRSEERIKG